MGTKRKKLGSSSSRTDKELTAILLVAFAFSCTTIYLANPSLHEISSSPRPPPSGGDGIIDRKPKSNQNKYKTTLSIPSTTPAATAATSSSSSGTLESPPRGTISELVAWMLIGKDKDANTHHAALSRLEDSPNVPLEFLPGTLPHLNHVQTFQHCYADPKIYHQHHVQGGRGDGRNVRVSYSETYHLAYVLLPKCASSTARHVLKNEFQATERRMSLQPKEFTNVNEEEEDGEEGRQEQNAKKQKMQVITFVRDPLSRFYSQYDEAYVRTAPWQQQQQKDKNHTTSHHHHHPFPYLYEEIHSYQEYEDVFCPIETRNDRKDCVFRESKENGTLTSRFERFVKEYDGRDPFDIHLTLQVPMLSSEDGLPLHITQIYNTTDVDAAWQSIAKQFLGMNSTLGSGTKESGVIEGRSYPRRFNSKLVSVETQRRICQLVLLDYCCLNMPLPDVCKGQHYSTDGVAMRELFCVLDRKGFIQPGIFPG